MAAGSAAARAHGDLRLRKQADSKPDPHDHQAKDRTQKSIEAVDENVPAGVDIAVDEAKQPGKNDLHRINEAGGERQRR